MHFIPQNDDEEGTNIQILLCGAVACIYKEYGLNALTKGNTARVKVITKARGKILNQTTPSLAMYGIECRSRDHAMLCLFACVCMK